MQNKNSEVENSLKNIIFNQSLNSYQNLSQEIEVLHENYNFQQSNRVINEQREKQLKLKTDLQSSDDQELQERFDRVIPTVVNCIDNDQKHSQQFLQYLQKVSTSQKTYKDVENFYQSMNLQQIQNQILQNKQFQKCSSFQSQFSVKQIQPTKYFQIVTIWVQCGWYKTKLIVLNHTSKDNLSCPLHHCAHINSFGAFGNLYFIQYLQENYAVKCLPIFKQKQHSEDYLHEAADIMASALKEYFFLKLFSQLKIGPKINQSFGFDLIIYHDCIEFSMQICKPFILNQENEKKIIESMKKMHILQIVHRDIKKDNLMWSQKFQNPVFIDFGLTTFIKQRIGCKSMTRFAGTIGFVSPEMTKVFTEKKGVVDLYYNDLYGLNHSFQFLSKFANSENFIEKNLKPTKIRDLIFTMHMLKHKLFTKNYTEFCQMWQQLQKYHFYELQSIEYGLLEFMIDLRPNEFLSKLYTKISEQSRAVKEFEGLKEIYKSELITILSIWTKFPQKHKKFKSTIYVYKQVLAQYQANQDIEKKIEKILIGRQSIIKSMKKFRQNIFQENFPQQNIMIFFVVLAYYCTLAHDKYRISLEDKLQAAKFATKFINEYGFMQKVTTENQSLEKQRIKIFILRLDKLWFHCPLKQLQPMGRVYQFFMFHLWPELPSRFKNQILKFIISSLSLMGYPFYILAAKDVFKYYLFRDKTSSKLEEKTKIQDRLSNILLFWKSESMINVYSQICYDRQYTNFILDKQIIQFMQSEVQYFQQCLMHKHNDNSFLILNHHLYQYHTKTQVTKYPSDLIMKILNQLEKQKLVIHTEINWQMYYSQYKETIRLMFNYLPGRALSPLELGIIHQFTPITLQYEESIDMTLHFSSFLKYCTNSWNLQRVSKVLRIINETIVYSKLTERFYVDFRMYVAWKILDISAMKKTTSLVFEATQNISFQNLNYLKTIGMIVHKILLHERKGFWDLIIQKLICFDHLEKVIKRMKEYIQFYTNTQNLPHPDEIFPPIEKIKDLKNVRYKQRYCLIDECTIVNLILNQTQDRLFKTFSCNQMIISVISSLLRYAKIFLGQGLTKEYYKLLPNRLQIDVVTHLRTILPEKLKKSLFLSEETQNQYLQFLTSSINAMSSSEVSLSKYYNANWNQNNRLLMQVPFQHCQNFNSMVQNFNKAYQQQGLFKRVSTNSIETQIKPSPRVGVIYYLSKLIANKEQNIDDYRQLISFYKMWTNHYEVYKVMFQTQMIKYLVNAFIYCEVPFDEFLQLFLDITSFLKSIQDKFAVQIFREALWDKFYCVCGYCFPFPPKNWRPLQFIKHIYANRQKFTQSSHPYMGIVLIAATPNKYTPLNVKKKFVMFAIKSLDYLPSNARQYIMQHVYFQIFILKLINKGLYQAPEYNQQLVQIKPEIKVVYNDNIIRSEYYHAEKYFKSQKRVGDIDRLINQRYKVKQKRKPGWKLPQFIEKIYHKKIHRYHLFVNGFQQKVKIEPHVELLKQIQF